MGVYWHGLSGDLAAKRLSERSLLARDVIATLPEAERSIDTGNSSRRYLDLVDRLVETNLDSAR